MNWHYRTQKGAIHEQISALIPWYVNGTIGDFDQRRVESHLSTCAACREELLHERSVYRNVAAENRLGYMPGSSLKRLNATLDKIEVEIPELHAQPPVAARATQRPVPWQLPVPWRGLIAASVAVLTVAVGVLIASRSTSSGARAPGSEYYTVTTSVARPQGEVVRAVFAPTITLIELQAILDECQLRIISGPTEAGVYSLAATSTRPANRSLAMLREHDSVRFAESTLPSTEPRARR